MNAHISRVFRLCRSILICVGFVRSKSFVVNGCRFTLPEIRKSNILRAVTLDGYEQYEAEVVTLIKAYPKHLETFIDGGANIGFYSILAQAYFTNETKIIAVEPFSANVAYLSKLRKMNGFNFELVDGALDSESGAMKEIYYPTSSNSSELSCSASLINKFKGTNGVFQNLEYCKEQAKTVSLESLIEGRIGPALIKLDIEGNELQVMKASRNVLKRDNVDFIIELMINDADKEDVFSLMTEHGYRGYLITNSGLVREDRPLTFPMPSRKDRTIWKNHFFSKRPEAELKQLSLSAYGYWL